MLKGCPFLPKVAQVWKSCSNVANQETHWGSYMSFKWQQIPRFVPKNQPDKHNAIKNSYSRHLAISKFIAPYKLLNLITSYNTTPKVRRTHPRLVKAANRQAFSL